MTPAHRSRLVEIFSRVYADTKNLDDAVEMVVLADRQRQRSGPTSHDNGGGARIIAAVCTATGVTHYDLKKGTTRRTSDARKVAMGLLREAGYSYPRIASMLGLCDHTTVLKGVGRLSERPDLAERVESIRGQLQERAA